MDQPLNLCQCGCSTPISLYRSDGKLRRYAKGHINIGRKHSEETKRKVGQAQEGAKGNSWNGGLSMNKEGYIYERQKDHHFANSTGYVFQHRLIYERYYGCSLLPRAIIHHIDGNRANNDISNLELSSQSKHCGNHNKLRVGISLI